MSLFVSASRTDMPAPQLFLAQQVFDISNFFAKQIQFARKSLNVGCRAPIDVVIQLAAQAVLRVLAVLAHHDHWRLNGRKEREKKIQKNERVRIPGGPSQGNVDGDVDDGQDAENNNECPRASKLRHGVSNAFAKGGFAFNDFVGVAAGAQAHDLLRSMELLAKDGEHVHAGMRLSLEQSGDIVARDLQTGGLFQGDGVRLVRGFLQHGREAKEFAVSGLVDDHFLLILIDRGDANATGNHHVGLAAGVAYLVDALPRRELFEFDLARKTGRFVVVEQSKKGNVTQFVRIAGHSSPRSMSRE